VAGKSDGPRAARRSARAQAIAGERPDVVALQEVTRASDPQWRAALARLGLPHVISTTYQIEPSRRDISCVTDYNLCMPFGPDLGYRSLGDAEC